MTRNMKSPRTNTATSLIAALALIFTAFNTQQIYAQNILEEATSKSMQQGMERVGDQVHRYMHIQRDGIPFLGIYAGASLTKGEHMALRANFPGATGFTVSGGVGKDFLFNRPYKDKMTWFAGLGYYFSESDSWVVNLDLMAVKSAQISDVGIVVQAEYEYFIPPYRRFGVTADFGIGFGEFDRDKPKTLWEFGIGVAFKLFRR